MARSVSARTLISRQTPPRDEHDCRPRPTKARDPRDMSTPPIRTSSSHLLSVDHMGSKTRAAFAQRLAIGEDSQGGVLEEGWAEKESRHFGSWRSRWLVVFRELRTCLPYLSTFKQPLLSAPGDDTPRSTERLLLVGATCMLVASKPGRRHVFWLRTSVISRFSNPV